MGNILFTFGSIPYYMRPIKIYIIYIYFSMYYRFVIGFNIVTIEGMKSIIQDMKMKV